MTDPIFTGVGVALVTLFDESGEVDVHATAEHAARVCHSGLSAVVVAGTTGEAFTLDDEERSALLRAVKEAVPAGIRVIAGTGAPSIRQAERLTAAAVADGADAVMALSPRGAAQVAPYYEAVARAADPRPVLAYHFPAVSPPGIPVEDLELLPVAGLKDSSGDAERLLRELVEWDGHCYTGATSLLHLAGAAGATGAILAIANVEPATSVAAFGGDVAAQRQLVKPQHLSHPNPIGLKRLMHERFGTSPVCRVN